MECPICCSVMTGDGHAIFTTPCGHVYHEGCLKKWFNSHRECPQCRKIVDSSSIFQVFFQIDDPSTNHNLLMTRLSDIVANQERSDARSQTFQVKCVEMLEKLALKVGKLETENEALRLQNEKKVIDASKIELLQQKEEMRVKDSMISSLQKENNNLKNQRAITAREMDTIRVQIKDLKVAAKGEYKREPLKNSNDQKPRSVVLKFDNVSDQLIVEK